MVESMTSAPMATGVSSPVWPLPDVTRRRWTFGASRANGTRRHAGVDLYAPRGSVVLAPESGEVVATQGFNGPNAVALVMQTDSGPAILFGEVEPGSWTRLGLEVGSRVEAGQPVATVGINPGGSQMLHLEMYRDGTRRNYRWMAGNPAPEQLLDPTQYLQAAKALDVQQQDPVIPDDEGEIEDPDHIETDETEVEVEVEPQDPVIPDIMPTDETPQIRFPTEGLFALGVLLMLERMDG